jgi:hypothetical protein
MLFKPCNNKLACLSFLSYSYVCGSSWGGRIMWSTYLYLLEAPGRSPMGYLPPPLLGSELSILECFSYCHLSLIIVGKARTLQLEWSTIRGYTQVGYNLVCKDKTRAKVTENDKRAILLQQGRL